MSQDRHALSASEQVRVAPTPMRVLADAAACSLDNPHCITCSDEAVLARILACDAAAGVALVVAEGADATDPPEEIDISLVDDVAPGALVLVHGGVAIAQVEGARDGQ